MSRKRRGTYVSPVAMAHAALRPENRPHQRRCVLSTSRRIARLEPLVVSDLEKEEAPFRVVRWVAWGATMTERQQRADLVIHLRHTIETSQGGWLDEPQVRAAMDTWQAAIAEARRRGLPQPRAKDLPLATYQEAIGAVTRSARRSPSPPAPKSAPALVLTEDERAVLARVLRRAG